MTATEDDVVTRIGKIDFVVRFSEEPTDAEEARRQRVKSLTRWLLAHWRSEQEGSN